MILNLMSGRMKPPVLNGSYPADATIFIGNGAYFAVAIAEDGMPAEYTYQWYVNGSPVTGATGASFTYSPVVGTYSVYCLVRNAAGAVASRTAVLTVKRYAPNFSYTGSYQLVDDSDAAASDSTSNWKLRLLTSGTLTVSDLNGAANGIDLFLVGGGGGGATQETGGGGGGGYTKTAYAVPVSTGIAYEITVGAGGAAGTAGYGDDGKAGGNTSAFGYTANGGSGGTKTSGGSGGSGGGGNGYYEYCDGGSDGGNGVDGKACTGGAGQGTTTREFGSSGGTLYAGGGGGSTRNYGEAGGGAGGAGGGGHGGASGINGENGAANTGGGGGGSSTWGAEYVSVGGTGGSGIVIIRNRR